MTNIDEVPGLVPTAVGATLALPPGETRRIGIDGARNLFRSGEVLVAHAIFVAGRLKIAPNRPVYDALELFAFVRPAQPCIPSPLGLARALMLPVPDSAESNARTLHAAARVLQHELRALPALARERLQPLASSMLKAGWRWAPLVLEAIGQPERPQSPIAGFDIWRALPKWEDEAPPSKPGSTPVLSGEAMARLHQLVGGREPRPEQSAYAEEATLCFRGPRARRRAQDCIDRSRHGRRQNARLSRASKFVGGEEWPRPVDRHLHTQPATPDRAGNRAPLSRSCRTRRQGRGAQGPRELSLPAEFRRSSETHGAGAGTTRRGSGTCRALDFGDAGRRYFRSRVPRLPRRLFST